MNRIVLVVIVLSCASCSFEKLYQMRQARRVSAYEQIAFGEILNRYLSKEKTSVGTVEGIYSVSSTVTKKGKPFLSSTEKIRTLDYDENYSKVAIIRDQNRPGREYIEIPIDKNFLPTYSVRGEFTGMSEGNILVYNHFESRGRKTSYTFTYDKAHDILEGVRTENNGQSTLTYKLTYLKLFPKSGGNN
jgi:hypothetical protein